MKICFVPIDNRPVCYNLAKDIAAISSDIDFFIPPREYLGSLNEYADNEAIIDWLKNLPSDIDCMVLSLDTIAYGGLIPSRRITDSFDKIKNRIEKIKPLLVGKKVLAFSSIMRISNNNFNEEEKEYWKDWGKKIFEFSFYSCKYNKPFSSDIPPDILNDYLETRKRNFAINALYLDWQREGLFDTLIFSKDDCAEFGFNVSEAAMLENWGATTKTGADEIPLTLLARAIEDEIKIYPEFIEPEYKDRVSNYEDVSIEQSVLGQLDLGRCKIVSSKKEADITLIINNFKEKQGEIVMGWETEPYKWGFVHPKMPYAVADVRFANGADNNFVQEILKYPIPEYGYAGWNTSANTMGSLVAGIKLKWHAIKHNCYNELAFEKLQAIRFLDDWAYQANVRKEIDETCDIKNLMLAYEEKVTSMLGVKFNIDYTYPWNRKFEIEIHINE